MSVPTPNTPLIPPVPPAPPAPLIPPTSPAALGPRTERGQATAEYALVLLGAAAVALLLVAWANNSKECNQVRSPDEEQAAAAGGHLRTSVQGSHR